MKISREFLYVVYIDGNGEDIGHLSTPGESELNMFVGMIEIINKMTIECTRESMSDTFVINGYSDDQIDEWFDIIPLDCQSNYCGIREFKILTVTDVIDCIRG